MNKKWFAALTLFSLFALGVVVMRSEINRSGRAIGKLRNEVEVKEARNQYLQLEISRLQSPQNVSEYAREHLHMQPTAPGQVITLQK